MANSSMPHDASNSTQPQPDPEQDARDLRLVALARAVRQGSLAKTVVDGAATADQSHRADSVAGFETESAFEIPVELQNHPRYQVIGVLGRGGMGVVYHARHRMMQRNVALKVISTKFTANRLAVERFQQEVRAAAKLSHPNIVAAFDAEQAGDLHFLVMEFIAGHNLAQVVEQRGPLPIHEACQLMQQACLGLQHAHDRNMIHRDIKPQNLMVTPDGQLRILDFGLARLEAPGECVSQTAKTEMSLTAVGMVLGTPDFMAPEQMTDARSVDERSDVYSLGCTLLFLLTGQTLAFNGSFSEMLARGATRAAQQIKILKSSIPPGLIGVVERMTADDPAHRFQSASDAAVAIEPFCRLQLPQWLAIERPGKSIQPQLGEASKSPPSTPVVVKTDPRERRPQRRRQTKRPQAHMQALSDVNMDKRHSVRIITRVTIAFVAISIAVVLVQTFINRPSGIEPRTTVDSLERTAIADPETRAASTPATTPETQVEKIGDSATIANPISGGVMNSTAASAVQEILIVVSSSEFQWSEITQIRLLERQGLVRGTLTSWTNPVTEYHRPERSVRVNMLLSEVDPSQFDALFIVGGAEFMRLTEDNAEHRDMERITRAMLSADKPVCAIGAGPGVLASMKLLDNIPATGHPLIHDDVRTRFGVTLRDAPVIRSGNIITPRDVAAIPQAIKELRDFPGR